MAIFCYIYPSLSTSQFNIESLGANIYATRIFLRKHAGDGWQQTFEDGIFTCIKRGLEISSEDVGITKPL